MTTPATWTAVDDHLAGKLLPPDPVLDAVLAANAAANLPPIDVSPLQGQFLGLLVRLTGARAVLEIGTLGGYSTICLARALGPGGLVVTLELDPHHAAVAQANFAAAGVADRIVLHQGAALDTLPTLSGPFDLIFIDADKDNMPGYLGQALRLSRPGTAILCDNVVRGGAILDPGHPDPRVQGVRRTLDLIAAEPRLQATALQTVGVKGWDGLVLARVA